MLVVTVYRSILRFSKGNIKLKGFTVLPNSTQKLTFADKIFVVKLPAMPYIFYERELSREEHFVATLEFDPCNPWWFPTSNNFRLDLYMHGIIGLQECCNTSVNYCL